MTDHEAGTGRTGTFRLGKYTFLLACLLLLLILYPLLKEQVVGIKILDIFLSVILLSAVWAVHQTRRMLWIALGLAILALVSRWVAYLETGSGIAGLILASNLAFFILVIGIILVDVLRARRVSADQIAGAASVYLLFGIMWALVYMAMELAMPGSFFMKTPDGAGARSLNDLIYYSYVTLTTLGYGDITPVSPAAASFSTLEAIMGQLYLTILVARLVGLHITGSTLMEKEEK